jgi:predicted HAD superfamily Cof-like phosphohydrolase
MQAETGKLMNKMAADWTAFNDKVAGYPIPAAPELLSVPRANFRTDFMQEELDEFMKANREGDLDGAVDACIDLMYVTMGALGEMGVLIQPTWDEVQQANMRKQRGERSKRPGAQGFDAVKPEGWTGPSHADYLTITSAEVRQMLDNRNAAEPFEAILGRIRKPRILVLGYARHGKDTVCELLRDKYDFKFTSSSLFCAEHVLMPAFARTMLMPNYDTVEDCFNDRGNHRAFWYDQIAAYNRPDASRLGREIFEANDVYCGLRSAREFHALRNTDTYDIAIWIDASERVAPEGRDSCTVEPWMADYVLDNNGTPEDLAFNLDQLMTHLDLWQE